MVRRKSHPKRRLSLALPEANLQVDFSGSQTRVSKKSKRTKGVRFKVGPVHLESPIVLCEWKGIRLKGDYVDSELVAEKRIPGDDSELILVCRSKNSVHEEILDLRNVEDESLSRVVQVAPAFSRLVSKGLASMTIHTSRCDQVSTSLRILLSKKLFVAEHDAYLIPPGSRKMKFWATRMVLNSLMSVPETSANIMLSTYEDFYTRIRAETRRRTAIHCQPPELKTPLRPYQRRALAFALDRLSLICKNEGKGF